jgi:hypothetical protein
VFAFLKNLTVKGLGCPRSPPHPVTQCINTYPCTYSHRDIFKIKKKKEKKRKNLKRLMSFLRPIQ